MGTRRNAANAAAANTAAQESVNVATTVATSEKLNLTVNAVTVFDNDGKASVRLTFDESIKGYKANGLDFVESEVNYVDFARPALTKQLCGLNDLIADYRACRTEAFGQKEWAIILRGAKLTVVRHHHAAGELTGRQDANGVDVAYQRDCYTSDIVGVKLTDAATRKLERATEL